jgi:hypothetical protein
VYNWTLGAKHLTLQWQVQNPAQRIHIKIHIITANNIVAIITMKRWLNIKLEPVFVIGYNFFRFFRYSVFVTFNRCKFLACLRSLLALRL